MKNKAFVALFTIMGISFLFCQGLNIDFFGGESAQPYSYYADEIVVKSLPSGERMMDNDNFFGSISQLELNGNAWISFEQDNVTIYAQSIQYSNESQSIVASDDVSIIQTDANDSELVTLSASSEKATFHIRENRLVLEVNPVITMGENTIKGEKIIFFEDEKGNQYMNVHSGPGQRAHGSYVPAPKPVSENRQDTEPVAPSAKESSTEKRESLSNE